MFWFLYGFCAVVRMFAGPVHMCFLDLRQVAACVDKNGPRWFWFSVLAIFVDVSLIFIQFRVSLWADGWIVCPYGFRFRLYALCGSIWSFLCLV